MRPGGWAGATYGSTGQLLAGASGAIFDGRVTSQCERRPAPRLGFWQVPSPARRLRAKPVRAGETPRASSTGSESLTPILKGATTAARIDMRTAPKTSVKQRKARQTSSLPFHRSTWIVAVTCIAVLSVVAAIIAALVTLSPAQSADPPGSMRYLGLYERGLPVSYANVTAFTRATGVTPNVLTYYSPWLEPFQTQFAARAASGGAMPLVQINPFGVSLTAIASGQYDSYLSTYADAVRSYRKPVILSFGHEMNGYWYPWGGTHSSPTAFVAAWRHIVGLFRALGVRNVIWLWTVNIVETQGGIRSPGPWWPGSSYVNWIGIDGYYYKPSLTFAPLFGPTIAAVRELTGKPILIAETGVAPLAGQPAKIADLFAGIQQYGLLGFVWFDAAAGGNWRLSSPGAIAAFRREAKAYYGERR